MTPPPKTLHDYVPAFVIANSFAILINTLTIVFAFGGKESAPASSSGEVSSLPEVPLDASNSLDCYPVIHSTPAKSSMKGITFSCNDKKYLVEQWNEKYSDHALGGKFPLTKTLKELGCSIQDTTLRCRQEGMWSARGAQILAYREFVATEIIDSSSQLVVKN
jgi:hypothetical protein